MPNKETDRPAAIVCGGTPMSKWTPETVEYIRAQYLEERKSAGEIAKALNFAFTRNAITGKLFRMGALGARSGLTLGKHHGLPKVTPPPKPRAVAKRRIAVKAVTGSPRASDDAAQRGGPIPAADRGDLRFVARVEALFEGPGLSLFETQDHHCRWPAAKQGGVPCVCGKRKTRGAYCAHHARIAYGPRRRRRETG